MQEKNKQEQSDALSIGALQSRTPEALDQPAIAGAPMAELAEGAIAPPSLPTTESTKSFFARQTDWLQDTRLMAEAVYRLRLSRKSGDFTEFNPRAWPTKKQDSSTASFVMSDSEIDKHLNDLLVTLLGSRFVFLETIWETYLSDLVVELSHESGSFFEDALTDKAVPGELVKRALTGKYQNISDLQSDIGVIFAERTTRSPFHDQWKRMQRLVCALGNDAPKEQWFTDLEVYFCMRNCVIHRECRVSVELAEKSEFFKGQIGKKFQVLPGHLGYYRRAFIACVAYIEGKVQGYLRAQTEKLEDQDGTK